MRRRTESSTVAHRTIFVRSALAMVLKGGDKTGYGDQAAYELLGAREALLHRDVAAVAGPVLPDPRLRLPSTGLAFPCESHAIVRPCRSQPSTW
jgi:hypothetical protein